MNSREGFVRRLKQTADTPRLNKDLAAMGLDPHSWPQPQPVPGAFGATGVENFPPEPPLFKARITGVVTGGSSPPQYDWTLTQDLEGNGTWTDSTITGGPTPGFYPAYERSGNAAVPVDGSAVVPMYAAESGQFLWFDWNSGGESFTNLTVNNLFVTNNETVNNLTVIQYFMPPVVPSIQPFLGGPNGMFFESFSGNFYINFNGQTFCYPPSCGISYTSAPGGYIPPGVYTPPTTPLAGMVTAPAGYVSTGPTSLSGEVCMFCSGTTPATLMLTVEGTTDDYCSPCSAYNGTFTLVQQSDPCQWQSANFNFCPTGGWGGAGGPVGWWWLENTNGQFIAQARGGSLASYNGPAPISGDMCDCTAMPVTLTLDSGSVGMHPDCNWPATIMLSNAAPGPGVAPCGGTTGTGTNPAANETGLACCTGATNTLPANLSATVQWRQLGSSTWTTFVPSISLIQVPGIDPPQWQVGGYPGFAHLGTSGCVIKFVFTCAGTGFIGNGAVVGNDGQTMVQFFFDHVNTSPDPCGVVDAQIVIDMNPPPSLSGFGYLDGSFIGQTPGTLYDLRVVITR